MGIVFVRRKFKELNYEWYLDDRRIWRRHLKFQVTFHESIPNLEHGMQQMFIDTTK